MSPPLLPPVLCFLSPSYFFFLETEWDLGEPCCGHAGSCCCSAGGPQAAKSRRMRGARYRLRSGRTPAESAHLRRWSRWILGLYPRRFTTPTLITSQGAWGSSSIWSTRFSTSFSRTPFPKVRLPTPPHPCFLFPGRCLYGAPPWPSSTSTLVRLEQVRPITFN